MMIEIALEFEQEIFARPSTATPNVPDHYWVALNNEEVIGTVGLMKISNSEVVLKKMMVKKTSRGKENGTAESLLATALNWCEFNQVSSLFLGTMEQFKAAHTFYLRNGFVQILETNLPATFPRNPLDSVFFVRFLE